MKYELSWQIFEKSSNIKFHKNPSNGRRVVLCARMDGRTGLNENQLDDGRGSLAPECYTDRVVSRKSMLEVVAARLERYVWVEVELHAFFTLPLREGERPPSRSDPCNSREISRWCVYPKAGADLVANSGMFALAGNRNAVLQHTSSTLMT